MKPVEVTQALSDITGFYPDISKVKALFEDATYRSNLMFVRLWLAEGIPFAFSECPSLYQFSREWLSERLNIDPNEISLVGSSRLGYSFNPSKLGEKFDEKSDLDYVIVSSSLFQKCSDASYRFVSDFEASKIAPSKPGESRWWPQDVAYIKRNTPKGFINHGKVPNWNSYEETRYVEDQFSRLSNVLRKESKCPKFSKASFRIYKDHNSFAKRAALNLETALTN